MLGLGLKDRALSVVHSVQRSLNGGVLPGYIHDFELSKAEALTRRSPTPGPLEELFFKHRGRPAHKWVHYLAVYDQWLAPYRGTDIHMLEVGVNLGGSLELWREYLGPDAVIFGIDIDPEHAENVDAPNQVRIGDQADPKFLDRVVAEMGRLDVVFDDGSHVARHQRATFKHLFPRLVDGGLYGIEDLHTAYWRSFGGGYRRPGTAMDMISGLMDDMHGWYHGHKPRYVPRDQIESVTVYDSIAMIRKRKVPRPGHYKTPATADNAPKRTQPAARAHSPARRL